ncbi:MAG: tRNA (N(6)-L-threonylcarbamoyladenosine(37)-C(2))-methylthiotransferase MtaB [Bacilli bacterium]|nr:tRNA (N(6)-L-threonylcarbamoyladenosine(37)-C(2))-methylthiotransferase MtaB [Bacilli bacterium]
MKAAFYTLGCKVNSYETEVNIEMFKNNGYEIVPFNEKADVYVINTCSVTNTADSKSRKMIREAVKRGENAIVIVMGCYSQIKYLEVSKIPGVSIVIGTNNKSKILDLIEEYKTNKKQIVRVFDLKDIKFEDMNLDKFENHTRAFVKIQDGCNNYCTYCIIPYSRGNVRSKPKNLVIKEITTLAHNGYKEVVLTGIHTGHYGKDLDNYDFSDLLSEIEKIDGLERIRISSIEIVELDDKFMNVLKNSKKIVNHIHIPLQSGSNAILKTMNRRYNMDEFINKINEIRSIRPGIAITTDVIVGFPGETDELFNETVESIKKIGFTELHVFPYSPREGTPAAKMDNQVPEQIKKERVKTLIELSNKLKYSYYSSLVGSEEYLLTETIIDNYIYGHLTNYGFARIKLDGNSTNEIYKVKLISYNNEYFEVEKIKKC